ncbi:hypothetical protein CB696_19395 [Salmonella enterica subsp. enterica serovar Livingstone]|nr:hypothetical protein [Salmonella enterica subsp. enterica serovar Livingstone]
MEIRFAHEFINVKPRRLNGLIENEGRINAKCAEINYTFNGFVVSDNKPSDMCLSLTCNNHNETWNSTTTKRFLNDGATGCSQCFSHKRKIGGKTTPTDKIIANSIAACGRLRLIYDGLEEAEYINQYVMVKVSCADCKKQLDSVRYDRLVTEGRGRVCRDCSKARVRARRDADKKEKEEARYSKRVEYVYGAINERNKETGYILEGIDGDIMTAKFKINQRCPTHDHRFSVVWDSFINRTKGCKYCCTSAFRSDKPVYFYIQTLDDTYVKFGVTNRKVERRMIEQRRESKFEHELVKAYRFENGVYATKLERLIKSKFKCGVVSRDDMRDGYTETLPIFYLSKVMTLTNEFISVSKAGIEI